MNLNDSRQFFAVVIGAEALLTLGVWIVSAFSAENLMNGFAGAFLGAAAAIWWARKQVRDSEHRKRVALIVAFADEVGRNAVRIEYLQTNFRTDFPLHKEILPTIVANIELFDTDVILALNAYRHHLSQAEWHLEQVRATYAIGVSEALRAKQAAKESLGEILPVIDKMQEMFLSQSDSVVRQVVNYRDEGEPGELEQFTNGQRA